MSQRSKVNFAIDSKRARSTEEEVKESLRADDKLSNSQESIKSKRGPPKVPDQWTGIIKVEEEDEQVELKIRQLGADLLLDNAMPSAPRSLRA